MRGPIYDAGDIDTTSALRRAGAVVESFTTFQSVRALTSGAGTLTTGTRASKPMSAGVNDLYFESDTGWLYYFSTAWLFLSGLNSGTDAVRAAITVTANDNGATFFTNDQNKLWRVEAGAWVDKFTTIALTTSLKIGTIKVIGAQGAAVADATGGVTVDTEARAAINALLARLRTHGLIA